MKKNFSLILLFGFLLFQAACGSDPSNPFGTQNQIIEAGNPPGAPNTPKKLRTHVGKVPVSNGRCQAVSAGAIDALGNEKTVSIKPDCSFELPVQVGKAWKFFFLLFNNQKIFLEFKNGSQLTQPAYFVSDGEGEIQFGNISFLGRVPTAEFEALKQVDRDGDGLSDYDDSDDDNDGIPDIQEEDTDQDGFIDDDEF